jgi:hypothetical protein
MDHLDTGLDVLLACTSTGGIRVSPPSVEFPGHGFATVGGNPNDRPTKALYEIGSAFYPNRDSISYSVGLGCDSIIMLNQLATDEHINRALAASLKIWLYKGGGETSWGPAAWRGTSESMSAKLTAHPRISGVVVDQEEGWAGLGHLEEHAALEAWMNLKSETCSVIYTSYPDFRHWRRVAANCRRVTGSPQLYGIRSPATVDVLRGRGQTWREAFGGGYIPSLAAWRRTGPEQAAYLDGFRDMPGAMFWMAAGQSVPAVGSPVYEAIRNFRPGGMIRGPTGGWVVPVVLTGIALGGLAIALSR